MCLFFSMLSFCFCTLELTFSFSEKGRNCCWCGETSKCSLSQFGEMQVCLPTVASLLSLISIDSNWLLIDMSFTSQLFFDCSALVRPRRPHQSTLDFAANGHQALTHPTILCLEHFSAHCPSSLCSWLAFSYLPLFVDSSFSFRLSYSSLYSSPSAQLCPGRTYVWATGLCFLSL